MIRSLVAPTAIVGERHIRWILRDQARSIARKKSIRKRNVHSIRIQTQIHTQTHQILVTLGGECT